MKYILSIAICIIFTNYLFSQNNIKFSSTTKVDYTSRKNSRYQDNYINQITNVNGNLYVLGFFDSINKVRAKNIAVFNGIKWSNLNVGKDFEKGFFLTSYNNQLYLSGQWGSTSGVKRMMPDGRWQFVGAGAPPTYSDNPIVIGDKNIQLKINVMINYKGDLFCGGELMPIGSLNTNLIKWNGSTWSEVKPLRPYFGASITSMIEYNGVLYIGSENDFDRNEDFQLLSWDGLELKKIKFRFNVDGIKKLMVFNNELIIASAHGLYRWNGNVCEKIAEWDIYDLTIVNDKLVFAYNVEDKIGILDNSFKLSYMDCPKESNHKGLDYFKGSIFTSYCNDCRTDEIGKFFSR
jgi:hypothetical protein